MSLIKLLHQCSNHDLQCFMRNPNVWKILNEESTPEEIRELFSVHDLLDFWDESLISDEPSHLLMALYQLARSTSLKKEIYEKCLEILLATDRRQFIEYIKTHDLPHYVLDFLAINGDMRNSLVAERHPQFYPLRMIQNQLCHYETLTYDMTLNVHLSFKTLMDIAAACGGMNIPALLVRPDFDRDLWRELSACMLADRRTAADVVDYVLAYS